MVNGTTYTDLKDGMLRVQLTQKDFTTKQIEITVTDGAGNKWDYRADAGTGCLCGIRGFQKKRKISFREKAKGEVIGKCPDVEQMSGKEK